MQTPELWSADLVALVTKYNDDPVDDNWQPIIDAVAARDAEIAEEAKSVDRWEYQIQQPTEDTTQAFLDAINDAGRDGWQFIESWETVQPDFYATGSHKYCRRFLIGRRLRP